MKFGAVGRPDFRATLRLLPDPVLNSSEIRRALDARDLVIEPVLGMKCQLEKNPVSIDLRLDNVFVEFKTGAGMGLDPQNPQSDYAEKVVIEYEDYYVIHPGKFLLGQSFEWIHLPNDLLGYLDGRSSMARYGLAIHETAGWIDPGFTGHIAFELANTGEMPVKLYPLQRIARFTLFRCTSPGYGGQYRFQTYPKVPPKVDEDLRVIRDLLGAPVPPTT